MIADKEKGERARKIHAAFFDKCELAIEQGFYLEAMCMEYAAIEARMTVIMRTFGFNCCIKPIDEHHPNVALSRKFECLKSFLNDRVFFKDTYFESEKEIDSIITWMRNRNDRIHGLYSNTEKYEDLVRMNKKLAKEGLMHAYTMYDEANRLKRLIGKQPELLKYFKGTCRYEKNKNCLKLNAYLKEKGIK